MTDQGSSSPVTAVLVARLPEPGKVKTRLGGRGGHSDETCATIAHALIECTITRLATLFDHVIAVDAAAS